MLITLIFALPALTALITPFEDTVAAFLLLVLNVIFLLALPVTVTFVLSVKDFFSIKVSLFPLTLVTLTDLTAFFVFAPAL